MAQPGQPRPCRDQPDTADDSIPAIPQWVMDWGFFPFTVVAIVLLVMIADIGHVHGSGVGWSLSAFSSWRASCSGTTITSGG
jgi:hypothetical protein